MSNKTPRELAIAYARSLWKTNHGNIMLVADSERDYLAGLEAGAKMGWDRGKIEGRISEFNYNNQDSKVLELEFESWWASLGVEK